MNLFKSVFLALVTLTWFPIHETVSGSTHIFNIISDTKLQRKIENKVEDLTEHQPWSPTLDVAGQFHQALAQYVSLATEAYNEQKEVDANKNAEESIPLPDIYVDLIGENKFHDVSYNEFGNFKKSTVRTEVITPDASNLNTFKIIYGTNVDTMMLNGTIDVDDLSHKFHLTIYEPFLQAEYVRTRTTDHKLKTKSILDTFSFRRFILHIFLTEENRRIESPDKQLLRRLADSWFVTIADALTDRYIKPHISKHSEFFLDSYQKRFINDMCSSFKKQTYMNGDILPMEQKFLDYTYRFTNINYNFNYPRTCDGNSVITKMAVKNNCDKDAFLLHNVIFVFAYPISYTDYGAHINWTSQKMKQREPDNHGYVVQSYESNEFDTPKMKTAIIDSIIVRLSLLSTKNGDIINIYDVDVDLQTRNLQNKATDDQEYQYPQTVRTYFANQIKSQIMKYL